MAAVQPPSSSVHSQQHSVIQAAGQQLQQQLQTMHDADPMPAGGAEVTSSNEDPAKARRDMMTRRPSYRKILNDLSGDSSVKMESYGDDSGSSTDTETTTSNAPASNSGNFPQSNHVSTSLVSHPSSGEASVSLQNLQAIQIAGNGQTPQPTVVQLTANGQAYTIRGQLPQGVVLNSQSPLQQSPQQLAEEATRKREMRLLKNREAAKECRRKKKEYVKCLENRVAVLENQNKQLIEELKSLKDLYCNKQE